MATSRISKFLSRKTITRGRLICHAMEGLFSGIPNCCVEFYCRQFLRNPEKIALRVARERGFSGLPYELGTWIKDPCQYVSCDKCWQDKSFAVIKANGSFFTRLLEIVDQENG
jgi:hypothetical protein